MTLNPKQIEESEKAVNALQIMRENNITSLLVVRKKKYIGVVHLHDILREGIF
jgi:arabinose-5-phosphate isomerase